MSAVADEGGAGVADGAQAPRSSFLDRLVVRHDLLTFCAPVVPAMLTNATLPSVVALVQQVGSRPSLIPVLVAMILPSLWLAYWMARELYLWWRPHASERRLQALRAVVGERVAAEILDRLHSQWPGHPDHQLSYRDVLYEYWLRRLRACKAVWRTTRSPARGR